MSTKGCYGFRLNNKDYITFTAYDSYINVLGFNIMKDISQLPNVQLLVPIIKNIKFKNKNSKVNEKDIKKYGDMGYFKSLSFFKVFEEGNFWSSYLNEDSSISRYLKNDGFNLMTDDSHFIYKSLLCEYAYIVNLDSNQLEIYKGFNNSFNLNGRYAIGPLEYCTNGYGGCYLLCEIPLEFINHSNEEQLKFCCNSLMDLLINYGKSSIPTVFTMIDIFYTA